MAIMDFNKVAKGGATVGSIVEWNQLVTSGTKIAEVTIDDEQTNVYAPQGGGGGGDSVAWEQMLSAGTQIAKITINGNDTYVYAPQGGGGGGAGDFQAVAALSGFTGAKQGSIAFVQWVAGTAAKTVYDIDLANWSDNGYQQWVAYVSDGSWLEEWWFDPSGSYDWRPNNYQDANARLIGYCKEENGHLYIILADQTLTITSLGESIASCTYTTGSQTFPSYKPAETYIFDGTNWVLSKLVLQWLTGAQLYALREFVLSDMNYLFDHPGKWQSVEVFSEDGDDMYIATPCIKGMRTGQWGNSLVYQYPVIKDSAYKQWMFISDSETQGECTLIQDQRGTNIGNFEAAWGALEIDSGGTIVGDNYNFARAFNIDSNTYIFRPGVQIFIQDLQDPENPDSKAPTYFGAVQWGETDWTTNTFTFGASIRYKGVIYDGVWTIDYDNNVKTTVSWAARS